MAGLFRYRDMKANGHEPVFQSVNAATAIRESQEHIRSGRIPSAYAHDFALYQVGEEDSETGRIFPLEDPKHVIDLLELIEQS